MTGGAQSAYAAWVSFVLKRARRRADPHDVRLEDLPEKQCRAIGPEEVYCTLRYGHRGPCSWRRKKK